MLKSQDPDFADFGKKPISYVCFRTDVEDFFLIDFTPLAKQTFNFETSDTPEFEKNRILVFSEYLDGQDNGSDMLLFSWSWQKGDPQSSVGLPYNTARDKHGIQDLSLSEASLHIVRNFQNVRNTEVTQTIDVRRSTLRYSMDIMQGYDRESVEGRCVKYPR